MKLSSLVHDRDNNFNLIRITAAFAVLCSHSFLSVTGTYEPLTASLGMTLGSIAVDIFFITSGFLVTSSLISRNSSVDFVCARVLRIYPALVVMVTVSVIALGLFFSSFSLLSFLACSETHVFVLKNMTLFFGVAHTLPGVFDSIPYGRAVNGSLWSMPAEIRLYAILLILWLIPSISNHFKIKAFPFSLSILVFAASSFVMHFSNYFYFHSANQSYRLLYMFFTGATYFVLKERIMLSNGMFWLTITGLIISALNKEIFFCLYNILLAYIVFWLAYVPAGAVRDFNRFGDYSYGVYIYASPIQQSFAALVPGISVQFMILTSSIVTFFIAFLSWHLVEKRALRFKSPRTSGAASYIV